METPEGYPIPGNLGPNEPHRKWKSWGIPPYPFNLDPYSWPQPKEEKEKRPIELPKLRNYYRTPPIQNPSRSRVMYFNPHHRGFPPVAPMGVGSRWANRPDWTIGNDRNPFWHYVSNGKFGRTQEPKPWVIEKLRERPRYEQWKKATPTQRPETHDDATTVVSEPVSDRRQFQEVVVAARGTDRARQRFRNSRTSDRSRESPRDNIYSSRQEQQARDAAERFSRRRTVITPSDAKEYEKAARKKQLAMDAAKKFNSLRRP